MNRLQLTSFLLAISVVILTALPEAKAQTMKIMPLGNSITAGGMCTNGDIHSCEPLGGNVAVGYRQRLASRLNSAGYNFDFVGSETYGNSLMSDADCAGFGGNSDSQLAEIMETGTSSHPNTGYVTSGPYMNHFPADIVLLHIGTNDVLAGDVVSADIDRILDAIDDYETSHEIPVMVFLARIISTRGAPCWTDPDVIAYNNLVDNLAASRKAAGDSLIVVDMECEAGLDYYTDLMDQVHPNQDGYDKMGDLWFEAIDSWLKSMMTSYSLTMEPVIGSGSIAPVEGIHTYLEGTEVDLTATAATGYGFAGWSGDLVSTANPETVTMDENKNITATFTKLSYSLSITTDGTLGATVNPAGAISVEHGAEIAIDVTAIPSGNEFDGWEIVSGSSVTIADAAALSTTVKLESGDATVQANFRKVIVILDVSIPNTAGKIGDTIQSTISVENDLGVTLDLVSGEIGGVSLSNLVRADSTTYFADMMIVDGGNDYRAGEDIPVNNLVLTDGSLRSESYNKPVVQDNDPIDANAPVVNSLQVTDSVYGIGDTIHMMITADGKGYMAEYGTEINSIDLQSPRVVFSEKNGAGYLLSYAVEQGDSSVISGALEATVILMDEAGNISIPFDEIEDNALEINTSTSFVSASEALPLKIYPNPAEEFFYLNRGSNETTSGRINVIETSGRCVISKDVPAGLDDFRIEIQHLDRGIYMVHWIDESGMVWVGKLIKTE